MSSFLNWLKLYFFKDFQREHTNACSFLLIDCQTMLYWVQASAHCCSGAIRAFNDYFNHANEFRDA